MPFIQFDEKDLKRGTVITPGWYVVRIDHIGEKPSNDGGSINYPIDAVVLKNADNGDEKFKDVPLDNWMFNSKGKGFIKSFLEDGFGVTDINTQSRYDLNMAVGKTVEMFIGNDTYQGRIQNKPTNQFRLPRTT